VTGAYKFTRAGAVSPFSGVRWDRGEWVEGGPDKPQPCRQGVHACRPEQLPYWLNEELWEVELDGEIAESDYKLVGERGRLVERVTRWDGRTFRRFGESCAAQARSLGVAEIAADCEAVIERGAYALAVYFTSVAAERAGGETGRLAERARQARWLEQHVLTAKAKRRWLVFGGVRGGA
jgi:hypothetical protein